MHLGLRTFRKRNADVWKKFLPYQAIGKMFHFVDFRSSDCFMNLYNETDVGMCISYFVWLFYHTFMFLMRIFI